MRLLAVCLILGCGTLLAADKSPREIFVQARVFEVDTAHLKKLDPGLLRRLRARDHRAALTLFGDAARFGAAVKTLAEPVLLAQMGTVTRYVSGGEGRGDLSRTIGTAMKVAVDRAAEAPGSIESRIEIAVTTRNDDGEMLDLARHSLQFVAALGETRLYVADESTLESGAARQQFVLISIDRFGDH